MRQQCIAAAGDVQRREQAIALLGHAVDLLGRDLAGRRRDLDETRSEQAQLLGAIERLALHPPDPFVALPQAPIDRVRGELLRQAVAPALRSEARALSRAIERIAALRGEIAAKQGELETARTALATGRADLASLIQRRLVLERQLLPAAAADAAEVARLGHATKDVGDLIERTDDAADKDDRKLLARSRKASRKSTAGPAAADPTRPPDLRRFDPAASRLTMPVSGSIGRAFGAADTADQNAPPSQGIGLDATAGATVVAPFDGRVMYAGPFGALGLDLDHPARRRYHSLLAGLGQVDVRVGHWVLAGEPVGDMPDKPGVALYFELRRDGRPVDPQPWLAARDEQHGGHDGD